MVTGLLIGMTLTLGQVGADAPPAAPAPRKGVLPPSEVFPAPPDGWQPAVPASSDSKPPAQDSSLEREKGSLSLTQGENFPAATLQAAPAQGSPITLALPSLFPPPVDQATTGAVPKAASKPDRR